MGRINHLITVLKVRFYTISVKRALWNLIITFSAAAWGAIMLGKSIKEACTLGGSAAGLIILGYLQDARKGCSFRDQTDRLVNTEGDNNG